VAVRPASRSHAAITARRLAEYTGCPAAMRRMVAVSRHDSARTADMPCAASESRTWELLPGVGAMPRVVLMLRSSHFARHLSNSPNVTRAYVGGLPRVSGARVRCPLLFTAPRFFAAAYSFSNPHRLISRMTALASAMRKRSATWLKFHPA
jgi:hypothetical protein